MSIRERLQADLRQAMKERRIASVATLRSTLGAIDNAEAVPMSPDYNYTPLLGTHHDVPRRELTEADIQAIVEGEIAEVQHAIAVYEGAGKAADADELRAALHVLQSYTTATES